MKLLIINASPRRFGNISKRLGLMEEEAEHWGNMHCGLFLELGVARRQYAPSFEDCLL